jgi:hypothetical protein
MPGILHLATLFTATASLVFSLPRASCQTVDSRSARLADWHLRDGKLFVAGKPAFLKTAKPLRNFADPEACRRLAGDLEILQGKGYNAVSLNCYWHHFDHDGNGTIDTTLEPLSALIDVIYKKGMFPCLSVETYGVGGGQIPEDFWKKHPDALALNADGKAARDTEYGFQTAVPSIFHPAYRKAVRAFIAQLVRGIPSSKILYYETTVEPQFMGHQDLDFSASARITYEKWLDRSALKQPAWPAMFPVPDAFRNHATWLRFRAESLANWVNENAAAFRAVAGKDAYIAVNYLETCGDEMPRRYGNSLRFLEELTGADIIQLNCHRHHEKQSPNACAYRNVKDAMKRKNRSWAISEHMTLNGSDYKPENVPAILRSALAEGTGFGWEFVNVSASSKDPFALYNDDWSPKPVMAELDSRWSEWLAQIAQRQTSLFPASRIQADIGTPSATLPPSTLDFSKRIPLKLSATAAYRQDGWCLWDPSVIKDAQGIYHLFYARWKASLGFDAWCTHAEIARATSTNPAGPYTFQNVVLPARGGSFWDGHSTYNTCVIRAQGKYFLYYTGNAGTADWREDRAVPTSSKEWWVHRNHQRIGVAVADSPAGPWQRMDKPLLDVGPETGRTIINVPNMITLPTGAYRLYYKTLADGPGKFGGGVFHYGADSPSPLGPFTRHPLPMVNKNELLPKVKQRFDFHIDDHFEWFQGDRFYAIVKDHDAPFLTQHGRSLLLFESPDGRTWKPSHHVLVQAFDLDWTDRGRERYQRLEMPKLLIENGQPALLSLAALPENSPVSFLVLIPMTSDAQ